MDRVTPAGCEAGAPDLYAALCDSGESWLFLSANGGAPLAAGVHFVRVAVPDAVGVEKLRVGH